MHLETLPSGSRKVFASLKEIATLYRFVLAGGTGLALQLGHRISADLDLFTQESFSTEKVFHEMKELKLVPVLQQEEKGTLIVSTAGIKVSFFHYPYPFIEKKSLLYGIPIAGVIDVASMKVIAIGQRGAKRDFIDLFFILQNIPFRKIAENMITRFGADRISPVHTGKSLVYFIDADVDPDPKYCCKDIPEWKTIKDFFRKNVMQMVLDMDLCH